MEFKKNCGVIPAGHVAVFTTTKEGVIHIPIQDDGSKVMELWGTDEGLVESPNGGYRNHYLVPQAVFVEAIVKAVKEMTSECE